MSWLFASICASTLWIVAQSYDCDVVIIPDWGVTPVGVCLLTIDDEVSDQPVSKQWVCSADESTAYELTYKSQDCSGEAVKGNSVAALEAYMESIGYPTSLSVVCSTGMTCAHATFRSFLYDGKWDPAVNTAGDVPCSTYELQPGEMAYDFAIILGECVDSNDYDVFGLPLNSDSGMSLSCGDLFGTVEYGLISLRYASVDECQNDGSKSQWPYESRCGVADDGLPEKETLVELSCDASSSSTSFDPYLLPYSEACDSVELTHVQNAGTETESTFTRIHPIGVCLDNVVDESSTSNMVSCDAGEAYYATYAGVGCQNAPLETLTVSEIAERESTADQTITVAAVNCDTGNTCNYGVLRTIRAQNATMSPDCTTATADVDDDYYDEAFIIDQCAGGHVTLIDENSATSYSYPISEFAVCDSATSTATKYQVHGSDQCEISSWQQTGQAAVDEVLKCDLDVDGTEKQVLLSLNCGTRYPTTRPTTQIPTDQPTTASPTTPSPTLAPIDYGCNYVELSGFYIEGMDAFSVQKLPTDVCLKRLEDGQVEVHGSDQCEISSWQQTGQAAVDEVLKCDLDVDGTEKQVLLSLNCGTRYPTTRPTTQIPTDQPTTASPTTPSPTLAPIDYGCNYVELSGFYIEFGNMDAFSVQKFPTDVCLKRLEDGQVVYSKHVCRDDGEVYVTEYVDDVAECAGPVRSSLSTSMFALFLPDIGELEVSVVCGYPQTCKYGKVRQYSDFPSPLDCDNLENSTAEAAAYEDRAYMVDPCDEILSTAGEVLASVEYQCATDSDGFQRLIYLDPVCDGTAAFTDDAIVGDDPNFECNTDSNSKADLLSLSCTLTDVAEPPALPEPSILTSLDCDYAILQPPSDDPSWQSFTAWPIGVCTHVVENGVVVRSSQMLCGDDGIPEYWEYYMASDCTGNVSLVLSINEAAAIGVVVGNYSCATGNSCEYVTMAHVEAESGVAIDCEAETQPADGESYEKEAILLGVCLTGSMMAGENGFLVDISHVYDIDFYSVADWCVHTTCGEWCGRTQFTDVGGDDGIPVYWEYNMTGDCTGDVSLSVSINEAAAFGVVVGNYSCATGDSCAYVTMAHAHVYDGSVDCESETQPVDGESYEEEAILLGVCLTGSMMAGETGSLVDISHVYDIDFSTVDGESYEEEAILLGVCLTGSMMVGENGFLVDISHVYDIDFSTGDSVVSHTVYFGSNDCTGYSLLSSSGSVGGVLGDCPGDDGGKEVVLGGVYETPTPTASPTTAEPTVSPTDAPTASPTDEPTASPTAINTGTASALHMHCVVVMYMTFGFLCLL
eukprot:CAMPEP_0202726466 /NCGR_PEP_ID=MMETSP1385-20130828/184626_1 /ASSEMBLY_ACC=CAM_ASM_000861 /TAXON_ID=933848 /ORGANISM="Elphidium margaritaceum" /LENGTH=1300 /DNA_ID=CAMNT_0049392687 /DNA_START=98 /DNA_END=4002 /DNA_ORIENTATION=-